MPAEFLGLKACYKMEELAGKELASASRQVTQQYTSPSRRQTTSWGCGGEGKNGRRTASTGRKGAAGSSHPWLPAWNKKPKKSSARLQSPGKTGSPGSQEIWRTEEEEQLVAIKANECGGGPIWNPMKSGKDRKVPRTEK